MRAWLELVRAPAALSVPGDTMAGAAAAGRAASPARALSSVLLYWAGMALNDWSDRHADAVERPERPIPSGRVAPNQALAVAAGLTCAGLLTAAAGDGRRGLMLAGLLAGAVWAYDLRLKHTPAGPAAMATCRLLDVMFGAGGSMKAAPAALAIAAHTYGISVLGRAEVKGATPSTVAGAVAATATAAALTALSRPSAAPLLAGYLGAALPSQAALRSDPGPDHVRQAVRHGIMALIPLQAATVAGHGRPVQAAALLATGPAGGLLSRRMATS
ncbi:UbiA family prenyltransferase [Nonomuraea africana]|uniref:4-hydroxybenzoate polyprenyltransferase n=1 Tax=Nonomuraea africana TaxID=46171 RepID=A0ABR9KKW0_9ACTN|nr:UbiA family prenyltransferase [Nonomuraea africana]MBE1562658.1 4-hydroxybenzoate polyprenyltransferase [Nonomuraea africana]